MWHWQARYDGELQLYLKATGLQASDLVKTKAKKSKSSSNKASSYAGGSSPSHGDTAKATADSYSDNTVNGTDSMSAVYANAANGTTLPHFSQVWSSTAQDTVVFSADQLLAQMAGQAGHAQTGLYPGNGTAAADTGVLVPADDGQQLQPAIYQYVLSHSLASSKK